MAKSTAPKAIPVKKEQSTAPGTNVLSIITPTDKPILVLAGKKNQFEQQFVAGSGEVVVRFSNFSTKPKFFSVCVFEVDEQGNSLSPAPAPVEEVKTEEAES